MVVWIIIGLIACVCVLWAAREFRSAPMRERSDDNGNWYKVMEQAGILPGPVDDEGSRK